LMFIWPVISHSFSLYMTLGHQIFMIYRKHLFIKDWSFLWISHVTSQVPHTLYVLASKLSSSNAHAWWWHNLMFGTWCMQCSISNCVRILSQGIKYDRSIKPKGFCW
jgi:hypothetical protein